MRIVCQNTRSDTLEFTYDSSPVRLAATEGIADIKYTVSTSKNSGQDGENYTGSSAEKRNIILTLEITSDHARQADKLRDFYQPRTEGTIFVYNDSISRKATYFVESINPAEQDVVRSTSISLICPDPKFYDLNDQLTQMAMWKGSIHFPLRIPEPFVVTRKVNSLIANVYNESAVTQGLTIRFSATGEVVNPSLYDVNRYLMMKINITLHSGDVIKVTTGQGNKRVQLTSGGVTTSINNRMAYPPVWLQAYPEDNLFRYDADSGIDSLDVSIKRTPAYWGA